MFSCKPALRSIGIGISNFVVNVSVISIFGNFHIGTPLVLDYYQCTVSTTYVPLYVDEHPEPDQKPIPPDNSSAVIGTYMVM